MMEGDKQSGGRNAWQTHLLLSDEAGGHFALQVG